MGATHPSARRPPPALLGARGLVAPPWFPPPTIPSSFTNPGVPLPSDPPSLSVHEIHSHTHFLHMHNHFQYINTKQLKKHRTYENNIMLVNEPKDTNLRTGKSNSKLQTRHLKQKRHNAAHLKKFN